MKHLAKLFILFCVSSLFAQQPYYNNVDITLSGEDLYYALQQKIQIASTTFSYGDNKISMKFTDEDPENPNKVLLIYGYNDNDGNCTTDRSRDKGFFGGNNCQYNREHTFAKSNANPIMTGDTGIIADPQNLRPSDQRMNNDRGNRKMSAGSGNAGNAGSGWYPGDEWKGDVARIMMYMYTRYGDRCKPSLNGTGEFQGATEMLKIYLQWNAEDPVNDFEDQRNTYLEPVYGNRNPFIDNPYLATIIWGGPMAEDRWGMMGIQDVLAEQIGIYPNPSSEMVWVSDNTSFPVVNYSVYDIYGRRVLHNTFNTTEKKIDVSDLHKGIYLLELYSTNKKIVKKMRVQ